MTIAVTMLSQGGQAGNAIAVPKNQMLKLDYLTTQNDSSHKKDTF